MMDWDKLRTFYAVAQAKSLTQAGQTLGLSQSAVSRQVSALENSLQTALFHRHARGLILTEQGEILFRTVAEVVGKLKATENALMETRERPKGPLSIAAPAALGTVWLIPQLAEFQELYPEITLNLIVNDAEVDLSMRIADAAIRAWPSTQPDLIQRSLGAFHSGVYASNDYLRLHGVPRGADDLDRHRIVAYSEGERPPYADINWLLSAGRRKGKERAPVFRTNSIYGILRAVEAGMGIAGLPDYIVRGHPGLSKVVGELKGPSVEAFLVYPGDLRNSKRIRVFRDFLHRKLAEARF